MNAQAHRHRALLPDMGDSLQAKLHNLFNDTTPERCGFAIHALNSAITHLIRLRSELERGEQPTV